MRGFRPDNLNAKRTTARAAALVVNAVANATLTVTADTAGFAGNTFTVAIVTGAPTLDVSLAAVLSGTAITVTLGTDGAGVLDDAKNSGTLVAAAIAGITGVTCVTSGTGAGIVAPVAVQSLAAGMDAMSVRDLARRANVTDELIQTLERGGNCEVHEAQRLADAMLVTLSSLGSAL